MSVVLSSVCTYREDICLQTLLLLFKCANHRNKRSFVWTANEALVCTLMAIYRWRQRYLPYICKGQNQVMPNAAMNVMDEEPLLINSIKNFFVHHPRTEKNLRPGCESNPRPPD